MDEKERVKGRGRPSLSDAAKNAKRTEIVRLVPKGQRILS